MGRSRKGRWGQVVSIMLILTLVFSVFFSFGSAVFANGEVSYAYLYVNDSFSSTPHGLILDTYAVELQEGDTVQTVIERALTAEGIAYSIIDSGWGPYLESVDGLGSEGGYSGWNYAVNGAPAMVGISAYTVTANDFIDLEWSADGGVDIGFYDAEWNPQNTVVEIEGIIMESTDGSTIYTNEPFAEETLEYTATIPEADTTLFVRHTKNFSDNTTISCNGSDYGFYESFTVSYGDKVTIADGDSGYTYIVGIMKDLPVLEGYWMQFGKDSANRAIVTSNTPISADTTVLNWAADINGEGWDSVSQPLLLNDCVYISSGNHIYKYSESGSLLATAELAGSTSWYSTYLASIDGYIFATIGNGQIQALNATTLESLWVTPATSGYTCTTPITVDATGDGSYVYYGSGEDTVSGAYYCVEVTDFDPTTGDEEATLTWQYDSAGAYYWSGAAIIGNAVVFAGDDNIVVSHALTADSVIDTYSVDGDVRSSIVFDDESTNRIFVGTKEGTIYNITVDPVVGTLDETQVLSATLPSATVSTPVVYNNRLYVGSGNAGGNASITVFNASTLAEYYSAEFGPSEGWGCDVEGSLLLSTENASRTLEGSKCSASDCIYIYATANNSVGAIYCLTDYDGNTTANVETLYAPEEANQNYCVSSPIADENGQLYYGNDSGNIFALGIGSIPDPDPEPDPDPDPDPEPTTGTITGRLVDADGNPLAGYKITLHSDPITVYTDSDGWYTFEDVEFTEHELIIYTPAGEEIGRYNIVFTEGDSQSSYVDGDTLYATFTGDSLYLAVDLELDEEGNAVIVDSEVTSTNPKTGVGTAAEVMEGSGIQTDTSSPLIQLVIALTLFVLISFTVIGLKKYNKA